MGEELELQLYKRFQVLEKVGQGTYGVVFKVQDRRNGSVCALKKIVDSFQNRIDSQRTYREVLYLSQLSHPNIIKLLEVIPTQSHHDLYLLFEYVDHDLEMIIRLCPLAPIQRKFIIKQLLQALVYLHKQQLVHRDIKPANILIDKNCNISLCDFGLTRHTSVSTQTPLSDYVASRPYRPPEVALQTHEYGTSLDIWGVGCVLGQLILYEPVFVAESSNELLSKIIELVDLPKKADLSRFYSSEVQDRLGSLRRRKKSSLSERFYNAPDEEVDLLMQLLNFTPQRRITAVEALKHPYFAELGKWKEEEPSASISLRDECPDQESLRGAIELISQRLKEHRGSVVPLSVPLSQKCMDMMSSKTSYPESTDNAKTSVSRSKKLNKSKSTVISDKTKSRLLDSRGSSKQRVSKEHKVSREHRASRQHKMSGVSRQKPRLEKCKHKAVSILSIKSEERCKPSVIRKKASLEVDKKEFFSQKTLKDRMLQLLKN